MILKFCEDNFLFYITHTKYFDILCYFVIFLLIALFILVQKNEFIEKIKKSRFKMFFSVLFSGIFVGFLIFLFAWLLNENTFNGCSTKYYQNIYFKTENTINKTVNNLKNSKVIVVGDSRMELIDNDNKIRKPFNFVFIAKSGRRLSWLKDVAIPNLKTILKNKKTDYHVVFNMGVNDLNSDYNGNEIAQDYFEIYQSIATDYPNVKTYILSVNPIDENRINKFLPSSKRTNKKIKLFNQTIQKELKASDTENMYYCDAYNNLKFETDDGLHYTQDTNKKIINYIINDCVQF